MFNAIVLTCSMILFAAFAWRLLKFLRVIYLQRQFPGPPPLPLIGNANIFFRAKPEDVCQIVKHLYDFYGNTVKLWFGNQFSIFMSELKDVEYVLGTTILLEKSLEYILLRPWLHDGLLLSKGSKWFGRRKILTPAFHFGMLDKFVEIFDREGRIFVDKIYVQKLESSMNLGHWIHLVTLDIICESAMGVSVNAQSNADSEYVRAVKTISTVLHKRMFDILYRLDLTYKFTKLAREEKQALTVLHGFSEKVIVQRRAEILKEQQRKSQLDNVKKTEDEEVGVKRKMAFLDILLQSEIDGKPLSNLDIREEVDTFMFEGHDTTSSAITFFFYNIALYPECQQKCFDEIITVFGKDKSKPVTYDNLNNLHYVELCIKETLRMFPSVPLLGRKVTQECEINGKTIPAGTNIGISPLHLGRMEELFPNANTFKPERFDVVTSAEKMNPYAYIPFSAGPRNCIGQKFAMLEIKSIVTNVLRNFKIEYAGDTQEELLLVAELILRTRDPLMFKIKPRT